jgi:hypothetical protein
MPSTPGLMLPSALPCGFELSEQVIGHGAHKYNVHGIEKLALHGMQIAVIEHSNQKVMQDCHSQCRFNQRRVVERTF